jgi:hypothetical protein
MQQSQQKPATFRESADNEWFWHAMCNVFFRWRVGHCDLPAGDNSWSVIRFGGEFRDGERRRLSVAKSGLIGGERRNQALFRGARADGGLTRSRCGGVHSGIRPGDMGWAADRAFTEQIGPSRLCLGVFWCFPRP